MAILQRMRMMLLHPRWTSQEIGSGTKIWPALWFVTGFACLLGVAYFITYLAKVYPPPPAEWKVWLDTWGEANMLPYFPVPLTSYRLFLAISIIPGLLLLWLAMAGGGKLISMIFHGKGSFRQYLNLFGFSFFTFWLIAAVIDFTYIGIAGPSIVPALAMAYGPVVRTVVYLMPLALYPILFGLGGVYNGLATHSLEGFAAWKCALTGIITAGLALTWLTVLVR